ncbi:ADP-ribosylglycohydrolase family protein [Paenibacillus antri]|uniref:ADP-ribosylglycohydrolase family protein n=1 Tax=Paenibacillus antri TaxID=2582848 RepID=UPI0026B128F8
MLERFQGSLIGLAVGDALGTAVEFKRPGTFTPVKDITGGGAFQLPKGAWTDDTSMALCLAESLIECKGFNAKDQMERYVKWYRRGVLSSTGECFDIGNATAEALRRFEKTGEPFSGSDDPYAAGNGSIMRLAPVPLYYASDIREAIQLSAISSRTTHAATECVDACRLLGAFIASAALGMKKEELLSTETFDNLWKDDPLTKKILEVYKGTYMRLEPPDIQGSGYVVKSLEAALWAFYHSSSFEEGALLAVNLGDDADTTGAVYGQLAGAYYGLDEIPQHWVETIVMKEYILELGRSIYIK